MEETNPSISDVVKDRYGKVAKSMQVETSSDCCEPECCSSESNTSEVFTEKIDTNRATESLGCDIRLIETAAPKSGEIVVDLGSGPGHDTRNVADIVGNSGQVYGIDFTDDMIQLARNKSKLYPNIEYINSEITDIPIEDNFVDLVISNCVFNLVENKFAAFREAFRILKPGGRIVISDMIANTEGKKIDNDDYCACIGGATSMVEYISMMQKAGFVNISTNIEYESEYQGVFEPIPYQSVVFSAKKEPVLTLQSTCCGSAPRNSII